MYAGYQSVDRIQATHRVLAHLVVLDTLFVLRASTDTQRLL